MEEMAKAMSDIDVYLAPITANCGPIGPGAAANGRTNLVGLNTTLLNVTCHPGIVVRNGFAADGSPTSITFNGSIYSEAGMLSLAHAYQTAPE
jgi:Asp-tRNA(Asn)/Glu-tRNA(Gln) amidotransferase A subunit family amidase